ncbi:SRPBCC family protein [Nocardioides sp. SYSU D00038]|uniref:SRPBCC family protein n=1 Tax=Nocardioides sp. SYSU D00038 TaxID=2812554 RepID=UPI0019684F07|nr:SRPBCC family protein [Nocardioides sp. SYSU D00038]
MTRQPTGRVEHHDGRYDLFIDRTFAAPIEDVWAAVTEPERLARWIGTWTGDPASGHVSFTMTAEEGMPTEEMEIRECDPPRALRVTSHVGDDQWHLDLVLTEHAGTTTLTFSQPGVDPEEAIDVGPGWEYYLDRLVAAETGGAVTDVDFERDYVPGMAEHYRAQVAGARGGGPTG